jgi:hypothetical protein
MLSCMRRSLPILYAPVFWTVWSKGFSLLSVLLYKSELWQLDMILVMMNMPMMECYTWPLLTLLDKLCTVPYLTLSIPRVVSALYSVVCLLFTTAGIKFTCTRRPLLEVPGGWTVAHLPSPSSICPMLLALLSPSLSDFFCTLQVSWFRAYNSIPHAPQLVTSTQRKLTGSCITWYCCFSVPPSLPFVCSSRLSCLFWISMIGTTLEQLTLWQNLFIHRFLY